MSQPLVSLIRPGTSEAHRGSWSVWAGGVKMPHNAKMRGTWGWDVECSCGRWSSKTGGATKHSVLEMFWDHKYAEQNAADEGLPNSDPSTWPEDVLRDYIARHQAELRADADAEHELESRVS